jgi:putative two-component system response regulator
MLTQQETFSNAPYHILIVDDEPSCRLLGKKVMTHANYVVTEASNGEEALEFIANNDYDLVLLDKNMPGMSGDEVCRRIRSKMNLPFLPVIIITGYSSDRDLQNSLQTGANDFIRKPYDITELVARADTLASYKRMTDRLDNAESLLFALARMVEAKDEFTGDHCSRLAHTAVVFGQALELNEEDLLALHRGSILHDIGKLGVPESILMKEGPLNDDEWRMMKQHTVIGEQLCNNLKSMRRTLPIIRSHHERWDGSGYPDGLKGEEIPFLAQAFQIIDIYDALSHSRPYKEAFGREKIFKIFEEEVAKGWRNPELVDAFLDILRQRPDDLLLPKGFHKDLGARIFDNIISTGILDWGDQKHHIEEPLPGKAINEDS